MSITGQEYDLVIIGAGPTGLACALEAKRRGLRYVVLEKGTVVNSIVGYPTGMTFFSTPEKLAIGGIPFATPSVRPSRAEAIEYYQAVARSADLAILLGKSVDGVERVPEGWFVVRSGEERIRSRFVALATGYFDHVNRLGIPGEDLPKVTHYYREAYTYYGLDVLVVGGRNSAVEAALDLFRHNARVTMVHRGGELGGGVKYWLRPDIENRIAEGSIRMLWHTELPEIRDREVILRNRTSGERLALANDAVLALIGHRPDVRLLDSAGVAYDPETLVPAYRPDTYETNVPGLFLAGSVACGCRTWEIFIENGREHALAVVAEVDRRLAVDR